MSKIINMDTITREYNKFVKEYDKLKSISIVRSGLSLAYSKQKDKVDREVDKVLSV